MSLTYLEKYRREANCIPWLKPNLSGLDGVLSALKGLKKVAKMIEEKENKKEINHESI